MADILHDPDTHVPPEAKFPSLLRRPRHMSDLMIATLEDGRRYGVTFVHKVPRLEKGEKPTLAHDPITICVVSIIQSNDIITPFVDGRSRCHIFAGDTFSRAVGRKRSLAAALRKVTITKGNPTPVEALSKEERDAIWKAVWASCKTPMRRRTRK